jgi:hypothetical protein
VAQAQATLLQFGKKYFPDLWAEADEVRVDSCSYSARNGSFYCQLTKVQKGWDVPVTAGAQLSDQSGLVLSFVLLRGPYQIPDMTISDSDGRRGALRAAASYQGSGWRVIGTKFTGKGFDNGLPTAGTLPHAYPTFGYELALQRAGRAGTPEVKRLLVYVNAVTGEWVSMNEMSPDEPEKGGASTPAEAKQ